jgi:pimeloyl-ACP methyl ester carboxylesterase
MLTRPYRHWLIAAFVAALIYYAWGQITQTRGSQKVAFRPAEQTCGATGSLRYCVNRDRRGTNGDIVYHLHGRNLDARIWNDDTYLTALIQAEWQRRREPPPTVVTLSYGSTWLLSPKGEKADSALLDDLIARLPAIEAKVGRPRRRLLMGESMGGLNVLIAGLSHPARFDKVAALCPGVYAISPFAPLSTIRAAMERTGANPKIVFGVWMMARKYAANDAEWRRMSPLALIEQAGPDHPALYLSNGLYDVYGNFEGTERLANMARQRGVRTEWRPIYGGHCASDASSLATFLSA